MTSPCRSALYVPATNARALAKARDLPADVIIIDLEDSVAPDLKAAARQAMAAAVAQGGFRASRLVVRTNARASPWFAEDYTAAQGADAILLPKVEQADDLPAGGPPLWCMIETIAGVEASFAIAVRAQMLVLGLEDLAKELRLPAGHDGRAFVYPVSRALMAARAGGAGILDGVFADFHDEPGFASACRDARQFGLDGKTLIHPSQIATANAAFQPDPASLAQAERIVAAYEAARAQGAGVAVLEGRMIEALHARQAEALIAYAQACAERDGSAG